MKRNPKFEIVLYGRSLNLLTFIQGLLKRGTPANKIKLVIPTILEHAVDEKEKPKAKKDANLLEELNFVNGNYLEDTKEIKDYILDNISALGVSVYKNFNFQDVILNETSESIVVYKFTEEGGENYVELSASVIVTGGLIDVDKTVFDYIHENRLVYNGRAIIDKNFKTVDKFIFAAVRLCEFSQGYTVKYKLMKLER